MFIWTIFETVIIIYFRIYSSFHFAVCIWLKTNIASNVNLSKQIIVRMIAVLVDLTRQKFGDTTLYHVSILMAVSFAEIFVKYCWKFFYIITAFCFQRNTPWSLFCFFYGLLFSQFLYLNLIWTYLFVRKQRDWAQVLET